MFQLKSHHLSVLLHHPGDGFYLGTRFDRGGVFDSIVFDSAELAGRWFERYDPLMHDAVCGPAEEFSPVPSDKGIIKIGVGLLQVPDYAAYDRFKLYDIIDSGEWECFEGGSSVTFRHLLKGVYEYEKVIALTGEKSFEIRHTLHSDIDLQGEVYNHNFFTMGRMEVGPSRLIDFPFKPQGTWRAEYDSVGFSGSGIRFYRRIEKGESVYTGNIHETAQGMPYDMRLSEGVSVHIHSDVPCTHTVLWANHRIACLEPYNAFESAPGKECRWTVRYGFQ